MKNLKDLPVDINFKCAVNDFMNQMDTIHLNMRPGSPKVIMLDAAHKVIENATLLIDALNRIIDSSPDMAVCDLFRDLEIIKRTYEVHKLETLLVYALEIIKTN